MAGDGRYRQQRKRSHERQRLELREDRHERSQERTESGQARRHRHHGSEASRHRYVVKLARHADEDQQECDEQEAQGDAGHHDTKERSSHRGEQTGEEKQARDDVLRAGAVVRRERGLRRGSSDPNAESYDA